MSHARGTRAPTCKLVSTLASPRVPRVLRNWLFEQLRNYVSNAGAAA